MERILIISVCILFQGCSHSEQIDVNSIQVVRINQHPFFSDHGRRLIIISKNERTIDEVKLYSDTGEGCDSFLFDSGSNYVLVDCNGYWYEIEKATGRLETEGWKWHEKLPTNYLGRFKRADNQMNYAFVAGDSFKLEEVYRFKDPG